MAKVLVLGAAGSLGSHLLLSALRAGHATTGLVRDSARLEAAMRERITVETADLTRMPAARLAELAEGSDAVLNAAGTVSGGSAFVALVDHVLSAIERVPADRRPVCWFLAGAGLLDLGREMGRGVDLPVMRKLYWPHAANHVRLMKSTLDWRLLCPGPMTHAPAVGAERLRHSIDRLPVDFPAAARILPSALKLSILAIRMPQMIIPYADAADFMLRHIGPASEFSRVRVGLALPAGMKGKKSRWRAAAHSNEHR